MDIVVNNQSALITNANRNEQPIFYSAQCIAANGSREMLKNMVDMLEAWEAGAASVIVLLQPFLMSLVQPDVSPSLILAVAAQHVNETGHLLFRRHLVWRYGCVRLGEKAFSRR